jgi:hypothetical protein
MTPQTQWEFGRTELGYGCEGICLGSVVSICVKNGEVIFREECDGYHTVEVSKNDALRILDDAMEWIKGRPIRQVTNP